MEEGTKKEKIGLDLFLIFIFCFFFHNSLGKMLTDHRKYQKKKKKFNFFYFAIQLPPCFH